MNSAALSKKINALFEREEWGEARALLTAAREKSPESHWVLTQLGVTFYEQRKYGEALKLFEASRQIVPDCPLTLWNVAGALGAFGKSRDAIKIYSWLLKSTISPKQDPCWESQKWTASLKADCVFRLGDCFRRLGKNKKAEQSYRQYLDLLVLGVDGLYSSDDVLREIRKLHRADKPRQTANEIKKLVVETLQKAGMAPANGRAMPVSVPVTGRFVDKRRPEKKE